MEIPDGARQPQDHLPPAPEPHVDEDELLADMPDLTPPNKLRPRKRNVIFGLALDLRAKLPTGEDGEPIDDVDFDSLDEDTLKAVLNVFADVDDFAESIASDPKAYAEWAAGASYEQFSALLGRYASAVGESGGSSN